MTDAQRATAALIDALSTLVCRLSEGDVAEAGRAGVRVEQACEACARCGVVLGGHERQQAERLLAESERLSQTMLGKLNNAGGRLGSSLRARRVYEV